MIVVQSECPRILSGRQSAKSLPSGHTRALLLALKLVFSLRYLQASCWWWLLIKHYLLAIYVVCECGEGAAQPPEPKSSKCTWLVTQVPDVLWQPCSHEQLFGLLISRHQVKHIIYGGGRIRWCVNRSKSAFSNVFVCEQFQTPVDNCAGRVGRKVARKLLMWTLLFAATPYFIDGWSQCQLALTIQCWCVFHADCTLFCFNLVSSPHLHIRIHLL